MLTGPPAEAGYLPWTRYLADCPLQDGHHVLPLEHPASVRLLGRGRRLPVWALPLWDGPKSSTLRHDPSLGWYVRCGKDGSRRAYLSVCEITVRAGRAVDVLFRAG